MSPASSETKISVNNVKKDFRKEKMENAIAKNKDKKLILKEYANLAK